ncbi:sulfotransferase [Oceanibacterium hippocampi]|uniref:Sulfotransferase domain protein n=1 Tax=Oceanibacterium hippocampi TaxID=745714 RepID=A0A1Y5TTC6_9PROT|nr:sulfotransferase [Oceanibacterium hippocampi]SLN69216.1 Sulfotransferase domain protein [Oceanibacterium hippocampi]
MSFPPKAYLIGAQKSGTTTLAFLLDQHPKITVSRPKEPNFFNAHWEKGLGWYRNCFEGAPDDALLLDASPSYTHSPIYPGAPVALSEVDRRDVAERIHSVAPDARLIYILRDPIDRTYSSYWHTVRAGRETRPWAEAITPRSNYVATSSYHAQLAVYLEHFSLDQFLILKFDDLARDPVAVARQVTAFLGVAPADFPYQFDSPKNQSYQYNHVGRILTRIAGTEERFFALSNFAKRFTPPVLRDMIRRTITDDIPKLDAEERRKARALFADDMAKLKELTGISFD